MMFLIALVSVDRTYVGHGGAVEAGGSHGEAEVRWTDTNTQERKDEEEKVVKEKKVEEVGKSGVRIAGIS